jgi:hypothetical protein
MSNVEELNVEGLWGPSDGPFGTRSVCCAGDLHDVEYVMRTIMATGWTTFGSTLRRLRLHLPHYCYSVSIMPTFVYPRLEELDIYHIIHIRLPPRPSGPIHKSSPCHSAVFEIVFR